MLIRLILFSSFTLIGLTQLKAQCPAGINSFPFTEGFETNNGGDEAGKVIMNHGQEIFNGEL